MATTSPVIVWFRNDLRLADNAALYAAARLGLPVLPLYIHDALPPDNWTPGAASRWWLHHSLAALGEGLRERGTHLLLRRGAAEEVFKALVAELQPAAVYWNRSADPRYTALDSKVQETLEAAGVRVCVHRGGLLYAPGQIRTKAGTPHRVFTPFWNACLAAPPPAVPTPTPRRIPGPASSPGGASLSEWDLSKDAARLDDTLTSIWTPGEAGARQRLRAFLRSSLDAYETARDYPADAATSRLSPHLHWGELSARQVWHAVFRHVGTTRTPGAEDRALAFLREVAWGEFAALTLAHTPTLPDRPVRPEFERFPWRADARRRTAWQRGRTGCPFIDAGMRELWATGWMHNRARMATASFLVKHLRIPWQQGEAWFWDTLVDADLANNAMNWQWVTGSGVDAAPYFRIFNPVRQGRKFDPEGVYVRRWVPELAALPDRWLHRPWETPATVLRTAGVRLGRTYPRPIVDHDEARGAALLAYEAAKAPAEDAPPDSPAEE